MPLNSREQAVLSVCNLMLVDGSERTRRTLAKALEKHGYTVTACRSAQEALQAASNLRPNHVVTELKLPDGCGLRLLSQLKQSMPDAIVVVLTSYASIASAVEAMKRGAANYLVKPATADRIAASFCRHTGKRHDIPIDGKALSLERLEWEYINSMLMEHSGNLSAAARALSMHRRTLQRKLSKRAPHR